MDFKIKSADMIDFSDCTDIAIKAWEKGYSEYNDILGEELFGIIFPEWEKAKADSMEPYFKKSRDFMSFKVLSGNLIVGFITARLDYSKKVGTICNNAISPEFQGRGLGSMMYDFILKFFKDEGMVAAEVSTMNEDSYLPARKAYEKAGFEKKLEKRTYFMKL